MIEVPTGREKLTALYQRRFPHWAVEGEPDVAADIPLHPPTEAVVLERGQEVAAWIRAWRAAEQTMTSGSSVIWESRQWANAGTNRVPVRLVLDAVADLAAFVDRSAHWRSSRSRAEALLEVLVSSSGVSGVGAEDPRNAVRRRLKDIAELEEAEYQRLHDVLSWLMQNPRSGLFPRQIPVRGVHTKWLEAHQKIVVPLISSVSGDPELGLRGLPVTLRIKVLDPQMAPGGLRDLTVPVAELAQWPVQPRCVVVVENRQTLLGLADMPGAVAVHNPGSTGAPLLEELTWLHGADLIYWGDLDVEGLRILGRVRSRFPQTRSVLTDRATLKEHFDLTVPDHRNAPRTMPEHLTAAERDLFAALQEWGDVRLEQERIPWEHALTVLRDAVGRI